MTVRFGERLRESLRRLFRDEEFRLRLKFLRGVFLFHGLTEHALAVVARTLVEKSYAEGESIFNEGDVGRAFFIVASGRVRLFQTEKGQERMLAEVPAGGFFGEMVLLDELPRSASARAAEPATLYILYKSSFDALLVDAPHMASKVLHTLARLLSARLRRENFHHAASQKPAKTMEVM